MTTVTREVGARLKHYRLKQGLTQEELSERADLHNTYIGQIERGEKNLSVVTLDRLLNALNLSYAEFFEVIDHKRSILPKEGRDIAMECYDIVSAKDDFEQQHFLNILQEVDLLTKR